MSNIDSNTLADAIRNFVRQQNGFVSFVELSRQLPGIDGDFGLFPDGDGKRAKQARQASKQSYTCKQKPNQTNHSQTNHTNKQMSKRN